MLVDLNHKQTFIFPNEIRYASSQGCYNEKEMKQLDQKVQFSKWKQNSSTSQASPSQSDMCCPSFFSPFMPLQAFFYQESLNNLASFAFLRLNEDN